MNLSRWCRHALGAALAVMTLMGAARAQTSGEAGDTAEMVAMLTKFLASDEYRTGLTNHFRSAEPSALRPVCDELAPDFDPRQHRLTIVSPMAMDKGLGVPARGTWTSSVPVNRCGVVVRRTALAQAPGGGQIRFAALLPGDTLTTVKLQMDTVKAAEAGVGAQFGWATRSRSSTRRSTRSRSMARGPRFGRSRAAVRPSRAPCGSRGRQAGRASISRSATRRRR